MNRWCLSAVILAGALYYLFTLPVRRAPGIACPNPPVQADLAPAEWKVKDFTLTALADYDIHACILGKERYWMGREAELSPVDLALGWGPLSDQELIDKFSFSLGGRFCHWSAHAEPPLPLSVLETSASNVHILPSTDLIRERILRDFRRGQIVRLKGKLVRVSCPDGWTWVSSLSRTDTGAGACEILWVESCAILEG